MIGRRPPEYWISLFHELRKLPNETEWIEFKRNDAEPQDIGEYLSALANAAALDGKPSAYLLWGIDDATHEVVGTTFAPQRAYESSSLCPPSAHKNGSDGSGARLLFACMFALRQSELYDQFLIARSVWHRIQEQRHGFAADQGSDPGRRYPSL
ncbi:MAG: putative DNA binding domain-containing protein [Anaerolinea sp.]|nr:putative DNA binding domain-containing protein [Anaerolinea sp.]